MANPLAYKLAYRRFLPHIQPPGATLFVTFRLAGSIPAQVLARWRDEAKAREHRSSCLPDSERVECRYREGKRYFGRFDEELDRAFYGPVWLRDPAVASVVALALRERDGALYDLLAFTIMPNHVHMVITPMLKGEEEYHALPWIMHGLKRSTAWAANAALDRRGSFWQREYYDHYARDGREMERIIAYVLNNPVKAGLVDAWEKWPWTYWKHAED